MNMGQAGEAQTFLHRVNGGSEWLSIELDKIKLELEEVRDEERLNGFVGRVRTILNTDANIASRAHTAATAPNAGYETQTPVDTTATTSTAPTDAGRFLFDIFYESSNLASVLEGHKFELFSFSQQELLDRFGNGAPIEVLERGLNHIQSLVDRMRNEKPGVQNQTRREILSIFWGNIHPALVVATAEAERSTDPGMKNRIVELRNQTNTIFYDYLHLGTQDENSFMNLVSQLMQLHILEKRLGFGEGGKGIGEIREAIQNAVGGRNVDIDNIESIILNVIRQVIDHDRSRSQEHQTLRALHSLDVTGQPLNAVIDKMYQLYHVVRRMTVVEQGSLTQLQTRLLTQLVKQGVRLNALIADTVGGFGLTEGLMQHQQPNPGYKALKVIKAVNEKLRADFDSARDAYKASNGNSKYFFGEYLDLTKRVVFVDKDAINQVLQKSARAAYIIGSEFVFIPVDKNGEISEVDLYHEGRHSTTIDFFTEDTRESITEMRAVIQAIRSFGAGKGLHVLRITGYKQYIATLTNILQTFASQYPVGMSNEERMRGAVQKLDLAQFAGNPLILAQVATWATAKLLIMNTVNAMSSELGQKLVGIRPEITEADLAHEAEFRRDMDVFNTAARHTTTLFDLILNDNARPSGLPPQPDGSRAALTVTGHELERALLALHEAKSALNSIVSKLKNNQYGDLGKIKPRYQVDAVMGLAQSMVAITQKAGLVYLNANANGLLRTIPTEDDIRAFKEVYLGASTIFEELAALPALTDRKYESYRRQLKNYRTQFERMALMQPIELSVKSAAILANVNLPFASAFFDRGYAFFETLKLPNISLEEAYRTVEILAVVAQSIAALANEKLNDIETAIKHYSQALDLYNFRLRLEPDGDSDEFELLDKIIHQRFGFSPKADREKVAKLKELISELQSNRGARLADTKPRTQATWVIDVSSLARAVFSSGIRKPTAEQAEKISRIMAGFAEILPQNLRFAVTESFGDWVRMFEDEWGLEFAPRGWYDAGKMLIYTTLYHAQPWGMAHEMVHIGPETESRRSA